MNQQAIPIDADFQIPLNLLRSIQLIGSNKISHSLASQKFFQICWKTKIDPNDIAEQNNWISQSNKDELSEIIEKILSDNPNETQRFKEGEKKLTGFFMGQIMKATKGTANPKLAAVLHRKSHPKSSMRIVIIALFFVFVKNEYALRVTTESENPYYLYKYEKGTFITVDSSYSKNGIHDFKNKTITSRNFVSVVKINPNYFVFIAKPTGKCEDESR